MKYLVLAAMMVVATPAMSDTNFQARADDVLVCESYTSPNHDRLTLYISPSKMTVRLLSAQGDFTFPITNTITGMRPAINEFGRKGMASYVAYLEFRDNGGDTRMLIDYDGYFYHYLGKNQSWVYTCGHAL